MRITTRNFLLALSLFVGSISASKAEDLPTVKLGLIASLTGDAAKNGEDWLKGAKLAAEESNRYGLHVNLVVEDDGTNPTKAASAFNKLVTIDNVQGVVGGTWDFLAETIFPLAQKAHIPTITPTNPVEVFSESALHNPWVFTNGLSLASAVKEAREFLVDHKVKNVGLVVINVPYGLKHAEMLRHELEQQDIAISFEEKVTYEGFLDSLKVAALKATKLKPEAIFIVLNYAGVNAFLTELERAKYDPFVLMTHTLLEAAELGNFTERFNRARGIYQLVNDETFSSRYENEWKAPPTGYAASGFDAVACLAQAVAAKTFPIENGREFTCKGVTGTHIFSEGNRQLVTTEAVMMRLNDKSLTPADK